MDQLFETLREDVLSDCNVGKVQHYLKRVLEFVGVASRKVQDRTVVRFQL